MKNMIIVIWRENLFASESAKAASWIFLLQRNLQMTSSQIDKYDIIKNWSLAQVWFQIRYLILKKLSFIQAIDSFGIFMFSLIFDKIFFVFACSAVIWDPLQSIHILSDHNSPYLLWTILKVAKSKGQIKK